MVIAASSEDKAASQADAAWLYVAMTRALMRLYIVSAGPKGHLLPPPRETPRASSAFVLSP